MLRSWKTALAGSVLSAALFAGAVPEAEAARDLVVKRFLIGRLEPDTRKFVPLGGRGTQNAFRDAVIMVVFSTGLDYRAGDDDPADDKDTPARSVDSRTIQIGIPAGPGLFIQAEGSFYQYRTYQFDPVSQDYVGKRLYKNRVIFDPTKRFDDQAVQNPYGFEQNSLYTVIVPGLDTNETKTVRTLKGAYNTRTFTTTFRTTDKYLQDYLQPTIRRVYANDAPDVPLEGRSSVDSKADVIAEFSEPMLPAAFDPNTTFTVFVTSPGTGRLVSGVIRPSPDGKSFTFRPAFGYGQGPSTVRVTLSSSLTDRSGNALDKGTVVNFTSEFDPFAQQYNEIVEPFDDENNADWSYQALVDRASWDGWIGSPGSAANNTNKNQGLLAGIFGAKTHEITFTYNNGDGYPHWLSASRAQQLYSSSQMGTTPKTISGYVWRTYPGYSAANISFPGYTVIMGHNTSSNLSTNWTGSFSDTAVTTVSNVTWRGSASETEWFTGPAFATTWAYNGANNVVLDIQTSTGSGGTVPYWRMTQTAPQGGVCRMRTAGAATPIGYTWAVDIRFLYLVDKSESQSRWYDTQQNSPSWLDPIVTQDVPPGTVISVSYQGASENPLQPGTPDPLSVSPWTPDPLNELGGFRFIRFHVDMTSNISSNTKPTIDEIKLPYIYF